MDREGCLIVLVVVALHRADKADLVHALAQVREQVADQGSAAAPRTELPARPQQPALLVRQASADAEGLAVRREELRFVVEGVHVGHAAIGEDEDHPTGPACEMRCSGCQWITRRLAQGRLPLCQEVRDNARQQQRAAHQRTN